MDNTGYDSAVELYHRFLDDDNEKSLSGLEGLVELFGENLTRFIAGFVNDTNEAKDLMMDSFVKLGLSGARFENSAALKSYLFTIGKNLALNRLKYIRRDLETLRPINELLESVAGGGSPEDEFIKRERSDQLDQAMSRLKREHREILRLLYFENSGIIDASIAMNMTVKQVYNLTYNAKRALKKILESEGFIYG